MIVLKILPTGSIEILTYNLSKDVTERFQSQVSALAIWLSGRSGLVHSISFQKMGLFHNQKLLRVNSGFKGSVAANVKQIQQMIRHHAPPPGFSASIENEKVRPGSVSGRHHHSPSSNKSHVTAENSVIFAFRDNKPDEKNKKPETVADFVYNDGKQLLGLCESPREKLAKLLILWQKKGGDILTGEGMDFFRRHARLVHFCLTPILFMPRWRIRAYATRANKVSSDISKGEHVLRRAVVDHDHLLDHYCQEFIDYVNTLGFGVVKMRKGNNLSKRLLSETSKNKEVKRIFFQKVRSPNNH